MQGCEISKTFPVTPSLLSPWLCKTRTKISQKNTLVCKGNKELIYIKKNPPNFAGKVSSPPPKKNIIIK